MASCRTPRKRPRSGFDLFHRPRYNDAMATKTATRWIHLDHADDAEVMVHLESGDMFTLPLKAAIDACGSVENVQRFGKQMEILLARLADWIGQHAGDVEEAYVTFRDAGLLFLVVRKTR